MPVALRPALHADLAFCRRIEHETMRWIVEELFGWDEARHVERFARQWNVDEVRIITVASEDAWRDAGWLQTAPLNDAIFLKQIYLDPPFQRQGIGTRVMQVVIDEALRQSKAVTLWVVKINPARCLRRRAWRSQGTIPPRPDCRRTSRRRANPCLARMASRQRY